MPNFCRFLLKIWSRRLRQFSLFSTVMNNECVCHLHRIFGMQFGKLFPGAFIQRWMLSVYVWNYCLRSIPEIEYRLTLHKKQLFTVNNRLPDRFCLSLRSYLGRPSLFIFRARNEKRNNIFSQRILHKLNMRRNFLQKFSHGGDRWCFPYPNHIVN